MQRALTIGERLGCQSSSSTKVKVRSANRKQRMDRERNEETVLGPGNR